MRMKKLLSVALATAITLTSVNTVLPGGVETVKAETTATIEYNLPVNIIDSIDTPDLTSEVHTFEWTKSEDRSTTAYKLYFNVETLEYVHINLKSDVSYQNYKSLGAIGAISLNTQSGFQIKQLDNGLSKHEQIDKYFVLEKGTYYIYINGLSDPNSYGKNAEGTITTLIEAEKLSRTGNVTGQKKNAIKLADKKTSVGYISNTTSDQFFTFTVKDESTVKLNFYTTNTSDLFSKNLNYKLYSETGKDYSSEIAIKTKEGYNHTQCSLGKGFFYQMPDVGTATVTLPKGVYYFQFSAKEKYKDATEIAVGLNVSPLPKKISKLSVTAKKNTKKVVVNTIAKASVKVTVGKKTYKGKTNAKGAVTLKTSKLKKGTKVKVTVTKSGYKNRTKTVKVK